MLMITNIPAEIKAFLIALKIRDYQTYIHSLKVADLSKEVAQQMLLSDDDIENIYKAGLLHDIGKVGIQDSILLKKGPLTKEEQVIMKTHVILSGEILRECKKTSVLAPMVISHHERYDGTGYPYQLKGEEIPLGGRIICVADSFSAMMEKRSYKGMVSLEYAIKEIIRNSGSQFDPKVVDGFREIITKAIK